MYASDVNTEDIKGLIQVHPSITALDLQACYLKIGQIELITRELKHLRLLKCKTASDEIVAQTGFECSIEREDSFCKYSQFIQTLEKK